MKKVIALLAFLLISVFFSFSAHAQKIWKATDLEDNPLKENKTNLPFQTIFYAIETEALWENLQNAPKREDGVASNTIVSFPGVEGEMMDFYVMEASNFSSELAAKYPNIKSYRGIGVKNPELTISFSLSHLGLKAMIFGKEKAIFIEPVTENNQVYAAYHKLKKTGDTQFECLTEEDQELFQKTSEQLPSTERNANDQTLRTFRLAVSVTGEYTQYFGGTVADAMAAINATMTRVNPIFERDFAINMVLISNNDDVIYTNPASDPYSPSSGMGSWNTQLQNTLNAVIGFANYDIGHLFGASGGGGNAGCIGCVCGYDKGSGYTSPSDGIPEGDSFDIDYVAHEIGHQFGATHTHSATEYSGANLEPGSGSTIMSYAGITGGTDVQMHSDDFFHFFSIYQVTENIEDKTCPVETPLANMPPIVDAGPSYAIPSGTAFKLTATGSDPDGDIITYSWEQADPSYINNYSFPDPLATTGPLFRVNQPTTDPTRFFPAFEKVLNGDLYSTWETVPDVSRTLNFTVQVRDNNPNIGQTASDVTHVSVDDSNGAFKITSFNENETLTAGETYQLTWDVAGTNASPFNSPTVNILFSVDGGETFTNIAAATANDGSEEVSIPEDLESSGVYFMIESIGNIFYAVSPRLLVGFSSETTCQEFEPTVLTGTSFPLPIPEGGWDIAGAQFDVPAGLGEISDMNISIDISHTYISDLYILLMGPNGEQIDLWMMECGSEDDLIITFDDDGSPIACGSPTQGIFQPSGGNLSSLIGTEAGGSWFVGALDVFNGDAGVINDITIEICTTEFMDVPINTLENNISVYPNPANDIVNISFKNNAEKVSYTLYDLLGREILAIKETTEKSLDISSLPVGLYMLEIESTEGTIVKKVIKE